MFRFSAETLKLPPATCSHAWHETRMSAAACARASCALGKSSSKISKSMSSSCGMNPPCRMAPSSVPPVIQYLTSDGVIVSDTEGKPREDGRSIAQNNEKARQKGPGQKQGALNGTDPALAKKPYTTMRNKRNRTSCKQKEAPNFYSTGHAAQPRAPPRAPTRLTSAAVSRSSTHCIIASSRCCCPGTGNAPRRSGTGGEPPPQSEASAMVGHAAPVLPRGVPHVGSGVESWKVNRQQVLSCLPVPNQTFNERSKTQALDMNVLRETCCSEDVARWVLPSLTTPCRY